MTESTPSPSEPAVDDHLSTIAEAMASTTETVGVAVGPGLGATRGVPLALAESKASPPLVELLEEDAEERLGATHLTRILENEGDPTGVDRLHLLASLLRTTEDPLDPVRKYVDSAEAGGPFGDLAHYLQSGMLNGALRYGHDDLLDRALEAHGFVQPAYDPLSSDRPDEREIVLAGHVPPYLREWPAGESRAFDEATRLALIRIAGDGVLVVLGHDGREDSLVRAVRQFAEAPGHFRTIYWVGGSEGPGREAIASLESETITLLDMELDDFLAGIREHLELDQLPIPVGKASVMDRALDQELDLRPVLMVLPTINAYKGLIDKIPTLRVRTILLFLLVIGTFVAGWNLIEWWGISGKRTLFRTRLSSLEKRLESPEDSVQHAPRTRVELQNLEKTVSDTTLVPDSSFTVSLFQPAYEDAKHLLTKTVQNFKESVLAPALVRRGIRDQIELDRRFNVFAAFRNPVLFDPLHPLNRNEDKDDDVTTRLSEIGERQRLILLSERDLLLDILGKQIANESATTRRLPLLVPLVDYEGRDLLARIIEEAARIGQIPEGLLSRSQLETLLADGRILLVFSRLDQARNLTRAAFEIEEMALRHTDSRFVVTMRSSRHDPALLEGFDAFEVGFFTRSEVLQELRDVGQNRLADALRARDEMLGLARDPLVYSLLQGYYRVHGRLPATVALLYEIFVKDYLSSQVEAAEAAGEEILGVAPQKTLLSSLAHAMADEETLGRDEAISLLADELLYDPTLAPIRREIHDKVRERLKQNRKYDPWLLDKIRGGVPSVEQISRAETYLDELIQSGLLIPGLGGELRFITPGIKAYFQGRTLFNYSGQEFLNTFVSNPAYSDAVQMYIGLRKDPTPYIRMVSRYRVFGGKDPSALDPRKTNIARQLSLAARCLGSSRPAERELEAWIVRNLVHQLGIPIPDIRNNAIRMLAETGSKLAGPAVLQALQEKSEEDDPLPYLRALEAIGDSQTVPSLVQRLHGAEAEEASLLLRALARIADEGALETVWNEARSGDRRRLAARALLSVRAPGARKEVRAWLREEPEVWAPLAPLVVEPGDAFLVPALLHLLDTGTPEERERCLWAFERIGPEAERFPIQGPAPGLRAQATARTGRPGAVSTVEAFLATNPPLAEARHAMEGLAAATADDVESAAARHLGRVLESTPDEADEQEIRHFLQATRKALGTRADRELKKGFESLDAGRYRGHVAIAWARSGDPAIGHRLIAMIEEGEADPEEAPLFVEALGHIPDRAIKGKLIAFTRREGEIRWAAARSYGRLARIYDRLDPLLRLLESNEPERWVAARSLARLNDPSTADRLAEFVASEHEKAYIPILVQDGRLDTAMQEAVFDLLARESNGTRGLRIVRVTSENKINNRKKLLTPRGYWASNGFKNPEMIELALGRPRLLTEVRLSTKTSYPPQSAAREVAISVADSVVGPWNEVAVATLEMRTPEQVIPLPEGTKAGAVRLEIRSDHGHGHFVTLGRIQILPPAEPLPPDVLARLLEKYGRDAGRTLRYPSKLRSNMPVLESFMEHPHVRVRNAAYRALKQLQERMNRR